MSFNLFNFTIDVKKVNKETSTILKVLKGVKHKPTSIYKTSVEVNNERKKSINKMLNCERF